MAVSRLQIEPSTLKMEVSPRNIEPYQSYITFQENMKSMLLNLHQVMLYIMNSPQGCGGKFIFILTANIMAVVQVGSG
jgi:hypothetical protein